MALPKYVGSFRRVYRKYKRRAEAKGIAFDLDEISFKFLCEIPCTYCGAEPTPSPSHENIFNGAWHWNGLDRIDNTKGYIFGNVQPCCSLCNQLKSNLTEKDFLNQIQSIITHYGAGIKED